MFCQNYEISHGGKGIEVSESELVDCMLYLQDIGAHNINLVTPSNYTNLLQTTLEKAKTVVKLPIVWNSSGYETVANLRKMQGLVDMYLPDFKYSDDDLAWEYSHAKGYREVALAALEEMRRQQPKDVFDNDGMMQKGVIVRHLVCRQSKTPWARYVTSQAWTIAFTSVLWGSIFPPTTSKIIPRFQDGSRKTSMTRR